MSMFEPLVASQLSTNFKTEKEKDKAVSSARLASLLKFPQGTEERIRAAYQHTGWVSLISRRTAKQYKFMQTVLSGQRDFCLYSKTFKTVFSC